jgi:tRNA pseudouridine38/39 synthase
MMQMLFMVGKGAEEPEVIDLLLDVEKCPKKPHFYLAPAENLLLSDCGFEDLTPEMWRHDEGAYEVFSHFKQKIENSRVKSCLLGSVCEYL